MNVASLLTSEIELGQQLNHCVKAGERAEFALLLAMLSKDVTEQSQFQFQHHHTHDGYSTAASLDSLTPANPQPLIADNLELEQQSLELGKVAQEQGLIAARLNHCLQPDALSFALDKSNGIDTQVFDNLDLRAAQRFNDIQVKPQQQAIDIAAVLEQQRDYTAQLIA